MSSGYGDPIRWWSRFSPERIALVDRKSGQRLSYRDLDRLNDAWASVLQSEFRVAPGDRVAVLMSNRVEYAAILFACIRLRAVLVPLNWRLSASELSVIIDDATPVVIIGEQKYAFTAKDAKVTRRDAKKYGFKWIDVDEEASALLERYSLRETAELRSADVVVDGEEPAMVIYTSGSTGRPKGGDHLASPASVQRNSNDDSVGARVG